MSGVTCKVVGEWVVDWPVELALHLLLVQTQDNTALETVSCAYGI